MARVRKQVLRVPVCDVRFAEQRMMAAMLDMAFKTEL